MYLNSEMRPGEFRESGRLEPIAKRQETMQQPPPIAMALEQLERELHCLRELMRMLEQRLSPVMRPVPENPMKDVNLNHGSPLAGQIEIMTRLAAQSSNDVRNMMDCIEL
jgi:hypothetical protein